MGQVERVPLYSGIVLGSSIRMGRWLPEAVACLNRIKDELPGKLVAYFTTCLTLVNDTAENRKIVRHYMQPILNLTPNVKPIGLGLFAGSLDPHRQPIMGGSGPQGDYRDWEAIRNWARGVSTMLQTHRGGQPPDFTQTILSFTDMAYMDLTQVDLQGAELHSSYLVETNFTASRLEWADLSQSQLQGANLYQANLIGSILTDSILKDANLSEATLNGAILQNADLTRANLRNADLNWVDLSQANLTRATLQGARLGWAKLTDARLAGADLKGARYNEQTIWPAGFVPEAAGCINVGHNAK
jgi:menaquinone-dependent protoporphyrinogen IX oxidase